MAKDKVHPEIPIDHNHDELRKRFTKLSNECSLQVSSFLLWFILFILTNTGLILQVGRCRKNFVGPQHDPRWLRSLKNHRVIQVTDLKKPLLPGPKPRYFQLLQEVLHLRGNLHWRIPRRTLGNTAKNISSNAKNMTCLLVLNVLNH